MLIAFSFSKMRSDRQHTVDADNSKWGFLISRNVAITNAPHYKTLKKKWLNILSIPCFLKKNKLSACSFKSNFSGHTITHQHFCDDLGDENTEAVPSAM